MCTWGNQFRNAAAHAAISTSYWESSCYLHKQLGLFWPTSRSNIRYDKYLISLMKDNQVYMDFHQIILIHAESDVTKTIENETPSPVPCWRSIIKMLSTNKNSTRVYLQISATQWDKKPENDHTKREGSFILLYHTTFWTNAACGQEEALQLERVPLPLLSLSFGSNQHLQCFKAPCEGHTSVLPIQRMGKAESEGVG